MHPGSGLVKSAETEFPRSRNVSVLGTAANIKLLIVTKLNSAGKVDMRGFLSGRIA
jgi:hypothetical protein